MNAKLLAAGGVFAEDSCLPLLLEKVVEETESGLCNKFNEIKKKKNQFDERGSKLPKEQTWAMIAIFFIFLNVEMLSEVFRQRSN